MPTDEEIEATMSPTAKHIAELERENARLRDVAASLIAWIEAPTDDQSHTLKALQRKAEAALVGPTAPTPLTNHIPPESKFANYGGG